MSKKNKKAILSISNNEISSEVYDVQSNNHSNKNNLGNDDEIIEEVQKLYRAIKEGEINLDNDEKTKLIEDLQIISNDRGQNIFESLDDDSYSLKNNEKTENLISEVNMERNNDNIGSINNLNNRIDDSNHLHEVNFDEFLKDDSVYDDESYLVDNSHNHFEDDGVYDDESYLVDNSHNHFEEDNIEENYNNEEYEDISVDDALNDLIDDYSNEVAIKVNNVSMDYKLSKDKIDTLKEFVIRTIKRNKEKTKTIHALKNISFEIPKGDRVGIIGFNGAGKSTLLKLLAGVYDPTRGTIETKGKIAPLLELGAGFDQNYTGKANIFLNGAFLGYSEDFLKEKYDEILEFSELGDAINYHVKTYSSGMRAKLGFSIATIVEPDILIIDEILSVGDIKFQRKSSDKIRSLINSGITVLLVSHSVGQIRDLCNKAIWIDEGEIKMMGEVNKVCDAYVKAADNASRDQLRNIDLK